MNRIVRPAADRYRNSQRLLDRAERVIPLGSQTFSKSRTQLPEGAAPLFLDHGRGGRVWDVDGNEYVDLVCGLLAVGLGYRDPDVDAAIHAQLQNGISFSLATALEAEVAEQLVAAFPCAEMVRFGKNGTDATSACIRLARAHTGRDRVAVCGYHGWQDWYIGATVRNRGIPAAVCELTRRFPFGEAAALERMLAEHPGGYAAVMLEAVGAVEPPAGYLAAVKEITHRHGAVLIFDEVITGLRIARGGAQEHYGVVPDLASVGKALGNGMPISAVIGQAEILRLMEEVFYSGTFGGETLSLAAARAVLAKSAQKPVIGRLWQTGQTLGAGFRDRIARAGLSEVIGLSGLPPWQILVFRDHPAARKEATKTLFMREMLARGVLLTASLNVCYAHDDEDVTAVLEAVSTSLAVVAAELRRGDLESRLECPVILPVFAVRG